MFAFVCLVIFTDLQEALKQELNHRHQKQQQQHLDDPDYINYQKSKLLAKIGNQNLQYAKQHKAKPSSSILDDHELKRVATEQDDSRRQDQLAVLSRKVKQFEEKVQRHEQLMRNHGVAAPSDGGSGSEAAFRAQSEVNDQYVKAIEAKLKILDKL